MSDTHNYNTVVSASTVKTCSSASVACFSSGLCRLRAASMRSFLWVLAPPPKVILLGRLATWGKSMWCDISDQSDTDLCCRIAHYDHFITTSPRQKPRWPWLGTTAKATKVALATWLLPWQPWICGLLNCCTGQNPLQTLAGLLAGCQVLIWPCVSLQSPYGVDVVWQLGLPAQKWLLFVLFTSYHLLKAHAKRYGK